MFSCRNHGKMKEETEPKKVMSPLKENFRDQEVAVKKDMAEAVPAPGDTTPKAEVAEDPETDTGNTPEATPLKESLFTSETEGAMQHQYQVTMQLLMKKMLTYPTILILLV